MRFVFSWSACGRVGFEWLYEVGRKYISVRVGFDLRGVLAEELSSEVINDWILLIVHEKIGFEIAVDYTF